jgi:4-hydroxybenzoate polyprenyltransferase
MYFWMRLIRINNIVIAWISGLVVYYFFVWQMIIRYDLSHSLDYLGMCILMTCLGAVMAGGYIINNILDQQTDKLNDTDNPISRGEITVASAFNWYLILLIAGTVLAIWQALRMDRYWLSLLYPGIYAIMYFYSSNLKHMVFWGNCLIALACGSLPLLFLLAEWPAFRLLKDINAIQFGFHLSLLIFFGVFMFLVTLIREIIKDLEDMEGDTKKGSQTLPIVYGTQITLVIVDMLLLFLMGTLFILVLFCLCKSNRIKYTYKSGSSC